MATTVFPAPPPTTNALTPNSRTRFVRTTRKLSMMLGTTPLVVDVVPAVPALPSTTKPSAGHKRHGSFFYMDHAPTSWEEVTTPSGLWTYQWNPSAASDYEDSIPSRSSEDSTRSLPTKLRSAASLVHIPLLATSDVSDSDSSSSYSPVSRKGTVFRRRRACPPPLHLHVCLPQPTHPTPHRSYFSPDTAHPARGSTPAESDDEELGAYPREPLSPLSPPLTTGAGSSASDKKSGASLSPFTPVTPVAVSRARKMTKVTRILGEAVSPSLIFGRGPAKDRKQPASPVASQAPQPHPPLRGYRPPVAHARAVGPPSPRPFAERRRSASVSIVSGVSGVSWEMVTPPQVKALNVEHLPEHSRSPAVRREEAGWYGEWNANDMDQVRNRLRSLKIR